MVIVAQQPWQESSNFAVSFERANRIINNQKQNKMAKYIPMDLLKSLHGNVCGHSDIYFAERNGTRYTGRLCNRRSSPTTENEMAMRDKFTQAAKATSICLSDATERKTAIAGYKAQRKYKTLYGFVFAREYAKLG